MIDCSWTSYQLTYWQQAGVGIKSVVIAESNAKLLANQLTYIHSSFFNSEDKKKSGAQLFKAYPIRDNLLSHQPYSKGFQSHWMCFRNVLILEVSFLFVGLGFLHIFMLPQASVRCWQQPFSWTGSQRTTLCFGSTFSCATWRMRELFSCQIPTLTHNHTWHTYLCLLLPQSFGFVTYTYIYFFSSVLFMGFTAGEASGVHFLFTNGFSNLRSKGASSVSELTADVFPSNKTNPKVLQHSTTDVFMLWKF